MSEALALGHFWLPIRGHDAIRAAGSFVPWVWVIIFIIFFVSKFILQIKTTHCHKRKFWVFFLTY